MQKTHPPIPFTKAGFAETEMKQQELLAQRPEAVEELRKAREMGDLSENGAYKGARAKLSQIDRELRHLTFLIRHAKIVESTQHDVVEIGLTVTVNDGREDRTFSIVGGYESNPLDGKLSHNSPLGKMLLGKRVGEKVTLELPKSTITYTITAIS